MRVRKEQERGRLRLIGVVGRNLRQISRKSTANAGKSGRLFGAIGLFVKHVSPILTVILSLQAIISQKSSVFLMVGSMDSWEGMG